MKSLANSKIIFTLIFISTVSISCKKFIEVNAPVTSINSENVYTSDATAASVLTGIYAKISNTDNNALSFGNVTGISIFAGLSSDEFVLHNLSNLSYFPYYKNDLTSLNESGVYWKNLYPLIFITNSAIEELNNSISLTPSVKEQLMGEAKFLRAFFYFYLVNLYGDVPLITTTDWKKNAVMPRTAKEKVYEQIVLDLKDASNLLSSNYLKSDALTPYTSASAAERIRPTKSAASSLLARVYLYVGNWVEAEAEASSVITNSAFSLVSTNNTFLKNSIETIWSLQPVGTATQSNTGAGSLFILPSSGPNNSDYPIYLANSVVNSFETGDARKTNWIDSVKPSSIAYYFPKKYKIGKVSASTQEYIMILRLAELYLIRAEARAMQGKYQEAINDINKLRLDHGNLSTPLAAPANQSAAIDIILHERLVELFSEWGHRWFDLKRTNKIDAIMNIAAIQKGSTWSPYKALYPIPQDEISKDPNLIQNQGY